MQYNRFNIIFASEDQMKKALKYVRENKTIKLAKCLNYDDVTQFQAFLYIGKTNVKLWFKQEGRKYCYIFRLDGEEHDFVVGSYAYVTLKKYWPELPDLTKDPYYGYTEYEDTYSWNFDAPCAGIIGYNPKFNNTRHENCVGYDLNSAFAYAMLNPMPDTSHHPKKYTYVQDNEIGFDYDPAGNLTAYFKGSYCAYVFPLIDSPFKKFVKVWYGKKKKASLDYDNAKTKEEKLKAEIEKNKAKAMLTHSVGFLQRKNPFLRCAIITYSNDYIRKYIDENTLYWNTDSIVSLVRRPDIEKDLGLELGQWKIQHEGSFAYIENNYQWNKGVPTVRGIPKPWFPKDFDLLKQKVPSHGNLYEIDEKFHLRRIKYEKI